MPTSIAMPTVMPTRWPTPISAIERLIDAPLAADAAEAERGRQLAGGQLIAAATRAGGGERAGDDRGTSFGILLGAAAEPNRP